MVKVGALADSIRRLGHVVTVVGCGVGDGVEVIGVKSAFRFHSTPVPISLSAIKMAVLRSDVVHIVGYRDPVGVAAAHFAQRARVPYVLEPAGMHRRRIRSLGVKRAFDAVIGQRVVANAHLLIATSRLEKGELAADGVEESRIVVRPNGLLLEGHPVATEGTRRRFGIPEEAPLVIHVGRISAKKGLVPIVRAVRDMDQVWLLIAGPDDGDGTLQAIKAEAQSVGERIVIESQGLWDGEKWEAYAAGDVFCLHSETENFGNAVAEAAASGLPVAITDACGIAEWLDPEASRVSAFGDQGELVRSLRELLDPSAKRAAERAAPTIRRSLDWNLIAEAQVAIYERVLCS